MIFCIIASGYYIYRFLFFSKTNSLPVSYLLLLALVALWAAVSILFRTIGVHPVQLKVLIGIAGALIGFFALSYFATAASISESWVKLKRRILVGICTVSVLILLSLFLSGEIVSEVWQRESGLYRYRLSQPGSLLFGFSFGVIFISALISYFQARKLAIEEYSKYVPIISGILAMGFVVFPYKELQLPVVFFTLSAISFEKLVVHEKSHAA